MSQKTFPISFDKEGVPLCLEWTVKDVGEWIEHGLKFPQYKVGFTSNFIHGRRLIHMDASNLPRIGITDFEHIKIICKKIRELLGINEPYWNRHITVPPRDTIEHFIERKSVTGHEVNELIFEEHVRYLNNFKQHGVPLPN